MLNNRRAQTATEFAVLGSLIIVAFAFLINYSEKLNRQQYYIQQTFRAALQEARKANNSASYTRVAFNRMPNVSSPMELGQLQNFSSSANVLWQDGKSSRDADGRDILGVAKYQLNEAAPIDIPQHETLNSLIVDLGQYPDAKNSSSKLSGIITNLKNVETALGNTNPDYGTQQGNLNTARSSLTGISGIDASVISGLQEVANALPVGTAPSNTNVFTNNVDTTTTFVKSETPGGVITTTKSLNAKDVLNATVTIGTNQQVFTTHSLGEGGKYYPGDSNTLNRPSRSMQ